MIEVVEAEFTKEEEEALAAVVDAIAAGDEEAQARLFPKIKFRPDTLMAMKKSFGADYIREEGFNTERADKQFGLGWLDE